MSLMEDSYYQSVLLMPTSQYWLEHLGSDMPQLRSLNPTLALQ
jgi:hypothetical protein